MSNDEMRLPQGGPNERWQSLFGSTAARFEQQYKNESIVLPGEVQAMPVYEEWKSGILSAKLASPFWELAKPSKNQRCLDLGCGASFLLYPWRDWQAHFYGQDISPTAVELLKARAPQLNSKLFKSVVLAPAHQLNYDPQFFDLAIATGWSCYYPLNYWSAILESVRRVLKPKGIFVFDLLDAAKPLAEDWAVLETYLGAEVFLEPLSAWEKTIKDSGAKIVKQQSGELFEMYKVRF